MSGRSDDDVFLEPASQEEPRVASDDDFFPPTPEDHAGDAQGSRSRNLGASTRSGRFGAWVIGTPDESAVPPLAVLGVAEAQWTVTPPSPEAVAAHAGMPNSAHARGEWALLQYSIVRACVLDDPFDIAECSDINSASASAAIARFSQARSFDQGKTLAEALDSIGRVASALLLVPVSIAIAMVSGSCDLLVRSVSLGTRMPIASIVPDLPKLLSLRRLRELWRGQGHPKRVVYGPETEDEWLERYHDALLRLPCTQVSAVEARTSERMVTQAGVWDTDPLKCLNALDVVQYLRSSRCFLQSDERRSQVRPWIGCPRSR